MSSGRHTAYCTKPIKTNTITAISLFYSLTFNELYWPGNQVENDA